MSQYGAMGMADAGFSYDEILKWYYTDIEIEGLDDSEFYVQNVVIEENKNENDDLKVEEKEIKDEEDEEYGPLLAKMLDAIGNIGIWG